MAYLLIVLVGLGAGTLGGVIGAGSSLLLMPVLVAMFGPHQAVPIMAIGAIFGNFGRVLAWRKEVDWPAVGAWCCTALPGAVIGVHTLLSLPKHAVELAFGIFFLAMVPVRRWMASHNYKLSKAHLALLGGPVGFLAGLLVSFGPITVPIFTGYGLERGAFLGTEAAAAIAIYLVKVATFQSLDALTEAIVLKGLLAGSALMAGSFIAREIVRRMAPASHKLIIDGLMVFSGLSMIYIAVR